MPIKQKPESKRPNRAMGDDGNIGYAYRSVPIEAPRAKRNESILRPAIVCNLGEASSNIRPQSAPESIEPLTTIVESCAPKSGTNSSMNDHAFVRPYPINRMWRIGFAIIALCSMFPPIPNETLCHIVGSPHKSKAAALRLARAEWQRGSALSITRNRICTKRSR